MLSISKNQIAARCLSTTLFAQWVNRAVEFQIIKKTSFSSTGWLTKLPNNSLVERKGESGMSIWDVYISSSGPNCSIVLLVCLLSSRPFFDQFFTGFITYSAFGKSAHLHLDLKAAIREPRISHERSSALLETSIRPHVVTARHLSSRIQQNNIKISHLSSIASHGKLKHKIFIDFFKWIFEILWVLSFIFQDFCFHVYVQKFTKQRNSENASDCCIESLEDFQVHFPSLRNKNCRRRIQLN